MRESSSKALFHLGLKASGRLPQETSSARLDSQRGSESDCRRCSIEANEWRLRA